MADFKYVITAAVSVFLLFSCGDPMPASKDKYRMIPDKAYTKDPASQNLPPLSVVIDGIEYKKQYEMNFDETDGTRLQDDWNRPNTQRRATYWLSDTVYTENGALYVTTQAMSGNRVDEILRKNLSAEEYEKTVKPDKSPTKFPGDEKAAVSGGLLKNDGDLYGLFVARIKMKKQSPGHWSAFWLYGNDNSAAGREIGRDYEFDIFEYPRTTNSYDTTTHWPLTSGRITATKMNGIDNVSDWNTYALLWTKDTVAYFCNWELLNYFTIAGGADEILSASKKRRINKTHETVSPVPMIMHFSNEVGNIDFVWAGLPDVKQLESEPDAMMVDWYVHYTTDDLKSAAAAAGVKYGDYLQ